MQNQHPFVVVPIETIESQIHIIRGKKVMLDVQLADLYGVETKNLNKAVMRNMERFPSDFMFQLTAQEFDRLRFQIGTSKKGRGGRRYPPYAFTQDGVAMLSSLLNSARAIQVNIQIMRTFTKLRELLVSNEMLRQKIEELEGKFAKHDKQFEAVFEAIKKLLTPPAAEPKRRIGFHT